MSSDSHQEKKRLSSEEICRMTVRRRNVSLWHSLRTVGIGLGSMLLVSTNVFAQAPKPRIIDQSTDQKAITVQESHGTTPSGGTYELRSVTTENKTGRSEAVTWEGGAMDVEIGLGKKRDSFRTIITGAYEKFETYARAAGGDISFEISDLETVPRSAFDEIYYADVATLPNGHMVDLKRTSNVDEVANLHTVTYETSWSSQDFDWLATDEGRRMTSIKLDEALTELVAQDPQWSEIQWMTRYQIKVRMEEKERAYQAAFFWAPSPRSRSWSLRVFDHISQGLDTVLAETIPAEGLALEPVVEDFSTHEKIGGVWGCEISNDGESLAQPQRNGTEGHVFGSHGASARFYFRCKCDTDCRSTCTSAVPNLKCSENSSFSLVGSACHTFRTDTAVQTTSKPSNSTVGAQCVAGAICGLRSCFFCSCNIQISATILGGGVNFVEIANFSHKMDATYACAACEEFDPNTPILISLRGGYELTGEDDTVFFDIDADGELENITWTAGDGDEAFLVLDRNLNGTIDDGSELFGAATPQPENETPPNGFLALEVYDLEEFGGNGDRRISPADAIFSDLRLWVDSSHDGISQPSEMFTLNEKHIRWIKVDYIETRRQDQHGNKFAYKSKAKTRHGMKNVYDVFFVEHEMPSNLMGQGADALFQ